MYYTHDFRKQAVTKRRNRKLAFWKAPMLSMVKTDMSLPKYRFSDYDEVS